jgi:hypothetical protein
VIKAGRMKWLAILAAIIAVAVVTFKMNFPTYTYRYRLQLSLAIDGKIHTGSSVIEVIWNCGPKVAGLGRCNARLAGQAAVIDLGRRGLVVAALRNGEVPPSDGAIDAVWFGGNAFGNKSSNDELPALPHLTGRRNLSPDNFPRLIWFSNPADPKSAKKITVEDVPYSMDPTAHFTEAFVEITREPIVVDIRQVLPWLGPLESKPPGSNIIYLPNKLGLNRYLFIGDAS